ncbi:MAG: hypothetical protein UT72_C0030G0001, partial [Candidatus Woesebacteria bacterium GW2011_GWB1_40_101]
PQAPRFRQLLGPSFILLGLGLGSGEIILWPYLTSNFGMGIIWGAVLGITLQFFINMEIERYSLVRGESIFVGFARKLKWAPYWFIFSTFAGFAWPGIVAASAKLVGEAMGFSEMHLIAIAMLILMGVVLTLGPVLYKTMERFSMILIGLGVPAIFFLTLYLAGSIDWAALFKGMIGIGEGYKFLPAKIPIASFLAAFEEIKLEGARFEMTKNNLEKFKNWWRLVNWEHLIVFWGAGVFSICLLALLAYVSAYGVTTPGAGIDFVVFEAQSIGASIAPIFGTFFLVVGGLMLFSTQMTVMDATSRIMSENLLIIKRDNWQPKSLPKIYYSFLWAQILVGIIIFMTDLKEPLFLLTLGAVINAGAMFVHIGLTTFLNLTTLEKEVYPSALRIIVMVLAFAFFGYLTARTVISIL